MQGMWVQSLVGELRSHMPQGMVEKKKEWDAESHWLLESHIAEQPPDQIETPLSSQILPH